jgi:hypothetical protein
MKPVCCLFLATIPVLVLSELKILSTQDGNLGPAPCALICTGVLSYSTGWVDANREAYNTIDYRECGFVSPPTVTATLHGWRCPAVYTYFTDKTGTGVYTVEDVPASTLISQECDVHWTATGYNC